MCWLHLKHGGQLNYLLVELPLQPLDGNLPCHVAEAVPVLVIFEQHVVLVRERLANVIEFEAVTPRVFRRAAALTNNDGA